MAVTVDLSKLAAYAGQREKALILQIFRMLTAAQDCTLMQGIKTRKQLTKLTVGSVAKPFTSDFEATDSKLAFSDRELITSLGKGEWLIDASEFYDTWMEEMLPPEIGAATKEAIPFSKWVFQQILAQLSTDINNKTIWNGVRNAAGTGAADIADGFHTILKREITATKVVPFVTGSLATDAVAKVEGLYRSMPNEQREMVQNVYMSYASYDNYVSDYRAKWGQNVTTDSILRKAIDHSDGKAFLKPVLWMGNSNRVMVTPKENLIIGTDRESNLHNVKVLPRMWTLEVGAAFNIGCQFRDLEVLQVNDAN